MEEKRAENFLERPPIVAVMGHVDHGKTTLLDYVRKTNVAGREAGGITQSIGAYEIVHNNKRITFIDTPGHEAFSKMRSRGASVADFAIVVVAADDGVKPQTKEVIDVLHETKTPFVVAINKIDKPNADIERTKNDLMQAGVFLEGAGGDVSWYGISAKTGEGVQELLDLILLATELEHLTYDADAPAKGIVIEAKMDSRRGVVVSVIVKDGTFLVEDTIQTSTSHGKVRMLENFLGEQVSSLVPSSPALILGFETLPHVGEEFTAGGTSEIAEEAIMEAGRFTSLPHAPEGEEETVRLIVKADVEGSLEALLGILRAMPEVRIIASAIGDITDGDVKDAVTTRAVIVGFRTRATKPAENLARGQDVPLVVSGIIYELVKAVQDRIALAKNPPPAGELEVLAVFDKKQGVQLVGGKVLSGLLRNKAKIVVIREGAEIGSGKIINLQSQKKDVGEAHAGTECGMLFESPVEIKVGDHLVLAR